MSEPSDLVTPQQAVTRDEAPEPDVQGRVSIGELLEHLASTAHERAATASGSEDEERFRLVARLSRRLIDALAALPPDRDPADPPIG